MRIQDKERFKQMYIFAKDASSIAEDITLELCAKAALLCPGIVNSGHSRNKYDDTDYQKRSDSP